MPVLVPNEPGDIFIPWVPVWGHQGLSQVQTPDLTPITLCPGNLEIGYQDGSQTQ